MLSLLLSAVTSEDQKEKILHIYDRYHSLMAYTVSVALPNSERGEWEDIVQNTMVDIIKYIDRIDINDETGTKALCVTIAKRRAIDYIRSGVRNTLPLDDVFDISADDTYIPDILYEEKEAMDIIVRAINGLEDIYRDACRLKYINGLKEREIADILGISPKNAGIRIHRGRKILREKLRKELYNE